MRAGEDRVARPLVDRQRLAGQGRLIDGRTTGHHRAVDGDPLAGPHDHPIADLDLVRRDFELLAVAAHPRGPRRLVDQPAHGTPRAGESPRFQHLAQERDEDDLGRHERLTQDQRRQARLRQGQVGTDPAAARAPGARRKRCRRLPGSPPPASTTDPSGSRPLPAQQTQQKVAADQSAQERREGEERPLVVVARPAGRRDDGAAVEMMQVFWSIFTMHLRSGMQILGFEIRNCQS